MAWRQRHWSCGQQGWEQRLNEGGWVSAEETEGGQHGVPWRAGEAQTGGPVTPVALKQAHVSSYPRSSVTFPPAHEYLQHLTSPHTHSLPSQTSPVKPQTEHNLTSLAMAISNECSPGAPGWSAPGHKPWKPFRIIQKETNRKPLLPTEKEFCTNI